MANNLPELHPDHNLPTRVFNGSSVPLAAAHGHSFAAEYRQQMVSNEEPWPGQGFSHGHVNTTHIAECCKGTSFALALQDRKDNTKILVSKGREEQGKKKDTFCIDCSCHGMQACVAADCEAAPGAQ